MNPFDKIAGESVVDTLKESPSGAPAALGGPDVHGLRRLAWPSPGLIAPTRSDYWWRQEKVVLTMIDIHAHILPGVDDGAKNWEQSLEMAHMAVKDGIRVMVATPHLFKGRTFNLSQLNDKELILQHAFEVKKQEVINHWYKGWKTN